MVCSSSACWFSRLRLRLAQRARLLLELLVGDPQLLLLGLQLLGLALGLLEQVLEGLAVAGRAEGNRDRLADPAQQLEIV